MNSIELLFSSSSCFFLFIQMFILKVTIKHILWSEEDGNNWRNFILVVKRLIDLRLTSEVLFRLGHELYSKFK